MNDQLEADLKAALSRQVSDIPDEAGARLRSVDYRPRKNRIPTRLTVGSLAGAGATAGVVVTIVMLGGTEAAFAGWSPTPAQASAAQTSGAEATCQSMLGATPTLPGIAAGGPWSAVATDVRGPFTLVVYQDGSARATCLTGPSVTVLSRSDGHAGSMRVSGEGSGPGAITSNSSSLFRDTGSGAIKAVSIDHLASTSQGPYTLVDGQVDEGVTAVTLVRSDGEHVQATTGNGWFVAWWPGSQGATSAEITTVTGVTTQPLRTPPALPPAANGS